MGLEIIVLNEISQTQKDKHNTSHMCDISAKGTARGGGGLREGTGGTR